MRRRSPRRAGTATLIATVVALSVSPGPAVARPTPEELADRAWSERARGFVATGRVDPAPADEAVVHLEETHELSPDDLGIRFRLMEALYFSGHFGHRDRGPARSRYDRLVDLAEATVLDAERRGSSDLAAAHFWAAIGWGLWGMNRGYLVAGARNVAGRIRDHAQALVEIDPTFADAGGLRLLGRLHTRTPRFPLVTGWIDRARGIALLEQAYALSTADARNELFLAEALLDHTPDRRAEALELLRRVVDRVASPTALVEESEIIDQARADLTRETSP